MIPEDKVRAVNDIQSLLSFMFEELDWVMPSEPTLDELTFNWTGTELDFSDDVSSRLRDGAVRQLRPLRDGQPWGVFLVDFAGPRVYTTALRQVLRRLVPSRRTLRPDVPAWQCENILFICTTEGQRFTFAHFCGDQPEKAKLATFSWEPQEPIRTICEFNLPPLRYDADWDTDTWLREWQRAFDVEEVTRKFYREYRRVFEHVEDLIEGFNDPESKRLFTQRLFNRLMFIVFVQKKGWLKFDSETNYLSAIWNAYSSQSNSDTNFYHDRLKFLFRGLNTPNGVNGELKKWIGDVQYLNGGLFEEDEDDSNPKLFVPDQCISAIFNDLFNRFNFTVTESTPLDIEVAIDPEMLGKVFEELVTGRNEKGSYYTPKTVVSFMCREAIKGYLGGYEELVDEYDTKNISISEARELLQKLGQITVCDPACGSGAYLVGMLHELHELCRLLDTRAEEATARDDYQRKLAIIQNNLYGVDIDSFAVNIARLRLWLSLAVEYGGDRPEPLPNLDFKIEVDDSLTALDPQTGLGRGIRTELISQFREKKVSYLHTHNPSEKQTLRQEILDLRQQIADWTHLGSEAAGFDWAVEFVEVFSNGGFDITIANPPYGIPCQDPLRYQYFPRRNKEEPQSKDSYGLFIARALQLLKLGGFLTFIVSDTWRTIRTHRPLRRTLVLEATVLHLIDLPAWIFEATVNTCILSLRKQPPRDEHSLIAVDLRNLPTGDWLALEANLAAVAAHIPDVQTTTYARYTYLQSVVATYDNLSFFIGSPNLYNMMSDNSFVKLHSIAQIKVGLQTGDNEYYLRKRMGAHGSYQILDESKLLTDSEITSLTEQEKREGVDPAKYGGRHFVPYDKGGESDSDEGWLPNYYVPVQYFIDWSKGAINNFRTDTIADVKRRKGKIEAIKPSYETSLAAVIRNPEYYFRDGLTFSDTGFYAPTFRLGCSAVFDVMGMTIFSDTVDADVLLSILPSKLIRYIIKNYINHTVHTQVEGLKPIPIRVDDAEIINKLSYLGKSIINKQKTEPRHPYHLNEQKEIDTLVYQLYGLGPEDIRDVELWYCRRYPKLAEAQGVLDEVQQKYASHLARCELILSRPPAYWKSHPILQLIAKGEGPILEFKETLEADMRTGEKYPGVLASALKTIAAFLNTEGGTLLIGVSDSGEIRGLEKDFRLCLKHDADGLEQKLRSLLRDRFKPDPLGKVIIQFEYLPEGIVCRIDVEPSHDVVYLDEKDVYVRDGNTSRKLEGPVLVNWIRGRNGK